MTSREELILSYLVPVFNGEKFLQATLDSISRQKGEYEVIIVDDGSTDSTPSIAAGFAKRSLDAGHPAVVITQKNSGEGSAVNVGLDFVAAEYVCVLSADDLLGDNHLEQVAKGKKSKPLLMVPSLVLIDSNSEPVSELLHPRVSEIRERTLFFCECVPSVGTAVLASAAKSTRRRPYSHLSDYDFYLRLLGVKDGWDQVLGIPNVVCSWRTHDQNMSVRGIDEKRRNYTDLVSSLSGMNFFSSHEVRLLSTAALFRATLLTAHDGEAFSDLFIRSLLAHPYHAAKLVALNPLAFLAALWERIKSLVPRSLRLHKRLFVRKN